MITQDDLNRIEQQVGQYADQFMRDAAFPGPYALKLAHTREVCRQIQGLARSEGLGAGFSNLAATAALLHDLGRFPQYRDFQTFSDPLSRNHAAMSVGVVTTQGMLNGINRPARQLLLRSVALHNRPALPRQLGPDLDLLSRLLRDADKLDIFRVMTELYQDTAAQGPNYITHSLEDDSQVCPDLAAQLMRLEPIHYRQVRSLNDLKLFQAGMVLDLNFPEAFRLVKEGQVVPVILGSITAETDLAPLMAVLDRFVQEKMVR